MRRSFRMLRWEVVRQYRHGFYAVSVVLIPILVVLLRAIGEPGAMAFAMPPLLVTLLLITTFYFAAALLLLEKGEGTLSGLAVTPLRTAEYLAARLLSLSLLAIGESLVIVVAVIGTTTIAMAMIPGMVLLCALYVLMGTALITRYDSINEFLLPSVVVVFAVSLPLLRYAGIMDTWLFLLHPVQPALVLMSAAVMPAPPWEIIYGLGAGTLWVAGAYIVAQRSFARFIVRSAGT
jgi:fluoroquinolone transport system permease protein